VKSHETIFIAWYPFDWTVSPFYELVNISQVTISQCKKKYQRNNSILFLTYRPAYPIWQILYCFSTMLLIRTWTESAIKLFPTNRYPMQGIWFEGQKNIKNIPGKSGFMTGICCVQVYSATAVQTGGFNRSFICWYRVQEPQPMVTRSHVTHFFMY